MNKKVTAVLVLIFLTIGSINIVSSEKTETKIDDCGCDLTIEEQEEIDNDGNLLNEVEDMSILCGMKDFNLDPSLDQLVDGATRSSFSWRRLNGENFLSPAKSQGRCGSCWAFATVAAIESKMEIQSLNSGLNPDLSEQYMVSCCDVSNGCQGSGGFGYLDWIMDNDVISENCFEYKAIDSNGCKADKEDEDGNEEPDCGYTPVKCSDKDCSNIQTDVLNYIPIWDATSNIKSALLAYGPLTASMKVYEDFDFHWNHGGSSVYKWDGTSEDIGHHAVVIVGYDDSKNCWICKNSWGKGGGYDGGYFNIAYNECEINKHVVAFETSYGSDKLKDIKDVNDYGDGWGETNFKYTFNNIPDEVESPIVIGIRYKSEPWVPGTVFGPDIKVKDPSTNKWKLIKESMGNLDSYKWKFYYVLNDYVSNDNKLIIKITCPGSSQVTIDKLGINYINPPTPEPDLDASSDDGLKWYDVNPGISKTGFIEVENIGDKDSQLDWEVEESESWISCSPNSGSNLKKSNTDIITVTVYASNDYEYERSGTIKMVNSDDDNDYKSFDVIIETKEKKSKLLDYDIFNWLKYNFFAYNGIFDFFKD